MNSISTKSPFLKRKLKLEDKDRYEYSNKPKPPKPPRHKLRVLDVVNKDPEEFLDND